MEQERNPMETAGKRPDEENTRTQDIPVTASELIRFINSQKKDFAVMVQLGKEDEGGNGREEIHLCNGK